MISLINHDSSEGEQWGRYNLPRFIEDMTENTRTWTSLPDHHQSKSFRTTKNSEQRSVTKPRAAAGCLSQKKCVVMCSMILFLDDPWWGDQKSQRSTSFEFQKKKTPRGIWMYLVFSKWAVVSIAGPAWWNDFHLALLMTNKTHSGTCMGHLFWDKHG